MEMSARCMQERGLLLNEVDYLQATSVTVVAIVIVGEKAQMQCPIDAWMEAPPS
jgi:hypothetical protein